MNIEEGDIVLCTVERIEGTVVHVKIENYGIDGSIITSEIAPGRIRNLRDYVVPNKKIVCKVIRISGNHIDLSLRRVTTKERKEVLEEFNREKNARNVLKSILGKRAETVIEEIEKKDKTHLFLDKVRAGEISTEMFKKDELEKLMLILNKQKIKKIEVKKEIEFSTDLPNGLEIIKKILTVKTAEVKYISAGKYLLSIERDNLKEASEIIKEAIESIEKKAKQDKIHIEIKDRK